MEIYISPEKCEMKLLIQIVDSFLNFNAAAIEVWEWINDLVLHFIVDVITYSC